MGRSTSSNGGSVLQVSVVGSSCQGREAKVFGGKSVEVGDHDVAAFCTDKVAVKVKDISVRCSFGQLYEVTQRFDERKRQLVDEAGFGGLLYFPAIKQLDRRFVVWLMCRVDALAKTLVIDDDVKIKFDQGDVARVFGIPCGGIKIPEIGRIRKEVVSIVVRDLIGIEDSKKRSIKALQEVLDRDYGCLMTPRDCAAFKAAFVIYVLSTMLSPGSRSDYAYVDYWDAIADHGRLAEYDWCEYVIRKLVDAVVKIKIDLQSTQKVPKITGCTLFLQVLYLDSIDLGFWSMQHNTFPRIRAFPPDRIKCMIRADTVKFTKDSMDRVFGKTKLLPPERVCYSWGAGVISCKPQVDDTDNKDLWEATSRVIRFLDAPDEGAVGLYKTVLAFEPDVRLRFTAMFSIIPQLHAGSTSGQMCGVCNLALANLIGGSSSQSSYSGNGKRVVSADDVSCEGSLNNSGVVKKGRCEVPSVVIGGADGRVVEESCNVNCVSVHRSSGVKLSSPAIDHGFKDPWALGYDRVVQMSKDMCARLCAGERLCFPMLGKNHRDLDSDAIRRQLCGDVELDVRIVDAVISSLRERDATLYGGSGEVRWRHIVDTIFMGSLLAGRFSSCGAVVDNNFGSKSIGYAVSDCRMIFLPALVSCRWVCYAWMRDTDVMYLFDPLAPIAGGHDVHHFHQNACKLIREALMEIGIMPSSSCNDSINITSFQMVDLKFKSSWLNRSGVGTLMFCSMFDGQSLCGLLDPNDMECAVAVLIHEALNMFTRMKG